MTAAEKTGILESYKKMISNYSKIQLFNEMKQLKNHLYNQKKRDQYFSMVLNLSIDENFTACLYEMATIAAKYYNLSK